MRSMAGFHDRTRRSEPTEKMPSEDDPIRSASFLRSAWTSASSDIWCSVVETRSARASRIRSWRGGVGPAVGPSRDGDGPARHAGVGEQPHPRAGPVDVLAAGRAGGDPDGVADALDEDDRRPGAEQGDGVFGQLPRRLVRIGDLAEGELGAAELVELGVGEHDPPAAAEHHARSRPRPPAPSTAATGEAVQQGDDDQRGDDSRGRTDEDGGVAADPCRAATDASLR